MTILIMTLLLMTILIMTSLIMTLFIMTLLLMTILLMTLFIMTLLIIEHRSASSSVIQLTRFFYSLLQEKSFISKISLSKVYHE
jgi:hypothetical protein